MRRRIPLVAALSFVLIAAAVAVYTSAAKAQAPIRVSVNEVIVPVTVTDEKGRFVSNLTKDDFKVYDENKEQKIDFFSHEQSQPIVIGFLIDTSNGMMIHWAKYQEAATELMLNLLPGDKRYSGLSDQLRQRRRTDRRHQQRFGEDGGEDEQDQTRRRLGAFRCDLHGLHQPQDH